MVLVQAGVEDGPRTPWPLARRRHQCEALRASVTKLCATGIAAPSPWLGDARTLSGVRRLDFPMLSACAGRSGGLDAHGVLPSGAANLAFDGRERMSLMLGGAQRESMQCADDAEADARHASERCYSRKAQQNRSASAMLLVSGVHGRCGRISAARADEGSHVLPVSARRACVGRTSTSLASLDERPWKHAECGVKWRWSVYMYSYIHYY